MNAEEKKKPSSDIVHYSEDGTYYIPYPRWNYPIDYAKFLKTEKISYFENSFGWILYTVFSLAIIRAIYVFGYKPSLLIFLAPAYTAFMAYFKFLMKSAGKKRRIFVIKDYRIFARQGVFLRRIHCSTLTSFWGFEMGQNWVEWMFGLWHVTLYGDFVEMLSLQQFRYLKYYRAKTFFDMLCYETDRELAPKPDALKVEEELEPEMPGL